VERDLNKKISRDQWVWISHALILHGRRTCAARAPRCSDCPLADLCPKIGVLPPKKGDSK
jgi:endonuclease-3